MWPVLIAALGLAASRVLLPGDPEIRLLVGFLLLMLVACPVVALGIAAFARWAFTPPTGTGVPPDEDRGGTSAHPGPASAYGYATPASHSRGVLLANSRRPVSGGMSHAAMA
jgi:hypothetical protein